MNNTKRHLITENVSVDYVNQLEESSTLEFRGGMICNDTGRPQTLIGKNFKIIADGEGQIIGNNVKISGDWDVERVSLKWFDNTRAYKNSEIDWSTCTPTDGAAVDSSQGILEAVNMAGCKEVVIEAGVYFLNSPLILQSGVRITGEGTYKEHSDMLTGTMLIANFPSASTKENEFLIQINIDDKVKDWNWAHSYRPMQSYIKNLSLVNGQRTEGLKAIVTGDPLCVDGVLFDQFCQAVKYTHNYIDNKRVVNCTFYLNSEKSIPVVDGERVKQFAFDMGKLGDALIFEHNAIHDGNYNKGLKIYECGGGSIRANIINADISIEYCKGVIFECNHIEAGHNINIYSSHTTIANNFIHCGRTPSITVTGSKWGDGSIVTMSDNCFMFRDTNFYKKESSIGIPDTTILETEYDIEIDSISELKIQNCFRYWLSESFGKMYVIGVKIAKRNSQNELEPVSEFNNFSYALSHIGSISQGFQAEGHFDFGNDKAPAIDNFQRNAGVKWIKNVDDSDSYSVTYSYQIPWDLERKIYMDWNGSILKSITFYAGEMTNIITSQNNEYPDGFLIAINNKCLKFPLRLIRTIQYNNGHLETAHVDIPICGATFLYDNGISICGHQWITDNSSPLETSPIFVNKGTYSNGNMTCITKSRPTNESNWKNGDIIIYPKPTTNKSTNYNSTEANLEWEFEVITNRP